VIVRLYRAGVAAATAAVLASVAGAAGLAAAAVPLPGAAVIVSDVTGDVVIDRWPDPGQPVAEPRADLTSAGIQIGRPTSG
jgi:hypothetical protein